MDYYEKFKPEAEKAVEANLANVKKLERQVSNAEKRLADEEDRILRLERHREKLTAASAESLAGETLESYEKYQTSLRKTDVEITSRKAAVKQLNDVVLPDLQEKLTEARSFFHGALERFGIASATIVRKEINENLAKIGELFTACDSINRDFLEAFCQIYTDFGVAGRNGKVGLNTDDLRFHVKPFPWPADAIEEVRKKLNMGGLSKETQRAAAAQKEQERIEAHNKEQLANVKPQRQAPVKYPTVGAGTVSGRQELAK